MGAWRNRILVSGAVLASAVAITAGVITTPPPVVTPGNANVWVDTTGGTCARQTTAGSYVDSAACSTLTAAYSAAQPGDIVLVKAGTYGNQNLQDIGRTNANDVVMDEAPGENAVFSGLSFGATYDQIGAAHVTLKNFEVSSWAEFHRSNDVTFVNIRLHGAVFASGARDLNFLGGEWGDPAVTNDGGHPEFAAYNRPPTVVRPDGLTLDGVWIHDIQRPLGNLGVHTNCFHPQDGTNIIVRNSLIGPRCDVIGTLISPSGVTGTMDNITFENNVYYEPTSDGGTGTGTYSWQVQPISSPVLNITLRNNTFLGPYSISVNNTVSGRFVGNLMPGGACVGGFTFSKNVVWNGSACPGSGDFVTTQAAANLTSDGITLPGSSAINRADPADFPAKDRAGTNRPVGVAPDAGAYEVG